MYEMTRAMSEALAETGFESWAVNKFVGETTGQVRDALEEAEKIGAEFDISGGFNIVYGGGGGGGDDGEGEDLGEGLRTEISDKIDEMQGLMDAMKMTVKGKKVTVTIPGYGFTESLEDERGEEEEGGGSELLNESQREYLAKVTEQLKGMTWGATAPTTIIDTSYDMEKGWNAELQRRLDDWNRSLGGVIAAWGEEMNKPENRPTVTRKVNVQWHPVYPEDGEFGTPEEDDGENHHLDPRY